MVLSQDAEGLEGATSVCSLDLRGLVCPVPVVKVAKAIKEIEPGEVVDATATDPGVLADIPAWCHATGNELLKIGREGREFVFWVRRVK